MRWLSEHFMNLGWLWSPTSQIWDERDLWVVVMQEQQRLGAVFPPGVIDDYKAVITRRVAVDLDSIREREHVTRHDVKARLEEFDALAGGHQCAHLGMTSADIVDNVSLIKIRDSLFILAESWPELYGPLSEVAYELPFRGIKGAIGTMADQVDLLGSVEKAQELDRRVADRLGFQNLMTNVGQTYYRSLDLQVAVAVASLGLAAQPHWARHLLAGYQSMIAGYAGETWNEGDVSTSAVRRVALPGLFLSAAAVAARIDPPRFLDPVW